MKIFILFQKIVLLILISAIFTTNVFAQINVEIDKNEFKIKGKEGFKEAWKDISTGDEFFSEGSKGAYIAASEYYLNSFSYNENNAALNYKIGVCFIKSGYRDDALKYFERAYELRKNVAADILFMLGRSYHINYQMEKAIEKYKEYEISLSPARKRERGPMLADLIQACNTTTTALKNPVRVIIENLGNKINTSYPEHSPVIVADESMIYFTSNRKNTTGGLIDPYENQYYSDIYVSHNNNGSWTKSVNLDKPLNTKDHDATIGLSVDGQKMLVYKGKKNGGDIYVCTLKGNEWSTPKALPKEINSDAHESSAAFSPDGRTLYFVSNREDKNYGEHDIYKSTLNSSGKWSEPVNLGKTINTEKDDRSVFIHPDGRTLFFSSEGHNSLGGYDIYKSTLTDKGRWTKPENLGYPINTPGNDLFFVLSASGKHGYYASVKDEGEGDTDIYKITFLSPEKILNSNEDNLIASIAEPVSVSVVENEMDIKTIRLTVVSGTIKDSLTLKPLEAEIEIVDNEENTIVSTSYSNSVSGKYLISLPSGKNYGLVVKKEGYLFHSENFNIPKATAYQQIFKHIKLLNIAKDSKIVLRNIFFDTGKSKLRPESNSEIKRLAKLLKEHPSLKIEISGHTDNVGSFTSNEKLSKNRAKAVVENLVSLQSINASRLTYAGYADKQPISTNDTDEGRQENRRVEFKIIE